MLNTKLVSELIEQGDFSGVKEAMEKSLAEGSQTFEQDIARLITAGIVTREEGLAYADSPTNLMWRLQNDTDAAVAHAGRRRKRTTTSRPSPRSCSTCTRRRRTLPGSLRPILTRSMSRTLHLAEQLIACRSVTPDDGGCQAADRRAPAAAGLRLRDHCAAARPTRRSPTCGPCAAAAAGGASCSPSPATPTSCPPARSSSGTATPSCPPTATASSTAAARPT